jgi:hypothetical protein
MIIDVNQNCQYSRLVCAVQFEHYSSITDAFSLIWQLILSVPGQWHSLPLGLTLFAINWRCALSLMVSLAENVMIASFHPQHFSFWLFLFQDTLWQSLSVVATDPALSGFIGKACRKARGTVGPPSAIKYAC